MTTLRTELIRSPAMVLFPEEEAVRDRVVAACVALAKEISKEGSNPEFGPPVLYHYTSAAGLVGILERSTIWLSRAATLNDPGEVSYGWRLARDVVGRRWNEIAPSGTKSPTLEFYRSVVEVMKSNLQDPDKLGDFARLDPFVACFCEEPDLLSQWVYYTKEGGYCLGFQRDQLISAELPMPPPDHKNPPAADEGPLELCPVVYYLGDQRWLLAEASRRFEELLEKELSGEDERHWGAAAASAAICFAIAVGTLACRMKGEGFMGEKEWRLVTFPQEGHAVSPADPDGVEAAKHMKFRHLRGRIIPYMEATFPKGKAPIVSVTSGPTVDSGVAKDSIERLLKGNGYPWKRITFSGSATRLRE